MNQKTIPSEFEKLLHQAKELISSDPSAEQVITVLTSGGHILSFANHNIVSGETADEEAFIKTLAESKDTEIQYAICMWNDSTLDVPSRHLQNLLMDLSPTNQKAEFLLSSSESFNVKPLCSMSPCAKL